MKKLITITSFIALSCHAFAGPSYTPCPGSTNYIYIGNSTEEVASACGKPASTKQIKQPKHQLVQQTQWIYNYRQWNPSRDPYARGNNHPDYHSSMSVNFDAHNKVVAIAVNGQSVHSTNYCNPSKSISIGDTNLVVRQLCGQASIVQTVKAPIASQPQHVVVWTYPGQNFSPSLQLTFIDSKLTEIKQVPSH